MNLLPVAEAQTRLLDMAAPLAPVPTPLTQALGCWTTEGIAAQRAQPSADLSAMDGYAIRHDDLPGPWTLTGESAAGTPFAGTVGASEAVRIYTGAAVPEGADTVIVQEDVTREGGRVILSGDGPGARGKHIRKAGSDFALGQCVIPAGTHLSPRHLALAALAGFGALSVPRPARIALVSTGSELVPPGMPLRPGELPSSNSVMLRSMLAALPCEPADLGIVADDLDTLTTCFSDLAEHDIVVTTGGASVGDHDLVKPALEQAGGAIDFWKIRMRPGKPLISGRLGKALFLGLPGNPVSTFVTATLFLMPLVRRMAGCPEPLPRTGKATLGHDLPATGGRDDYMRGVLQDGVASSAGSQDSAALLALAEANCLIRRPANSPAAAKGDVVEILPL